MKNLLKITIVSTLAFLAVGPALASAQSLSELELQLKELEGKYQELLEQAGERQPEERAARAASRTTGTTIYTTLEIDCTDLPNNLSYGRVDSPAEENIKALQTFLKAVGDYTYPRATGFFGFETTRAVTRFQTREGIRPAAGYGVVEATTRDRIENISCANDASEAAHISPAIIPSGVVGQFYQTEIRTGNLSGQAV